MQKYRIDYTDNDLNLQFRQIKYFESPTQLTDYLSKNLQQPKYSVEGWLLIK